MKRSGFFDVEERLARLSWLGDQLEAFSQTVDFEVFRPDLNRAQAYSDGSKGGRPPFDPVLMFKILVIQTLNNLSDERTEYLINDRLSFMRFLGPGLSDRVPDAKTVWLFRERLTQVGAIEIPFNRFDAILRKAGDLADVRPDPGCYAGRGSEAAQYERGESGSSGGTDPAGLEGQAVKAVS